MAALIPERSYRWNFTVMGLDLGLFVLALSFTSVTGVLPLYIHHLTPSNLALGLLTGLRSVGVLLPPILVAGFTERLRRKKPFLLCCTTCERLPYLLLAVVTPLLAGPHPTMLLWLFFLLIFISTTFGGIALPAWIDLLAHMIPADWRGRFFGQFSALGGLLGIAGAAAAAELLHRFTWPTSFTLCFLCTSITLAISFVFIALGREPVAGEATDVPAPQRRAEHEAIDTPAPRRRAEHDWRRLPAIVRADRNFGRYLIATALITVAGMAASFYTVDAKRVLHLSDAGAGLYAVVLLACTTLGNVLWGYVGDHYGHKRVVEGGALCTGMAALLALAGGAPVGGELIYGLVFALVGCGSSGIQLAGLTFIVDFAPVAQRPTYVGLASIAAAPFALAPVLAGAVADRIGYGAIFALSALLALAATAIVLLLVRDPRMQSRPE